MLGILKKTSFLLVVTNFCWCRYFLPFSVYWYSHLMIIYSGYYLNINVYIFPKKHLPVYVKLIICKSYTFVSRLPQGWRYGSRKNDQNSKAFQSKSKFSTNINSSKNDCKKLFFGKYQVFANVADHSNNEFSLKDTWVA